MCLKAFILETGLQAFKIFNRQMLLLKTFVFKILTIFRLKDFRIKRSDFVWQNFALPTEKYTIPIVAVHKQFFK